MLGHTDTLRRAPIDRLLDPGTNQWLGVLTAAAWGGYIGTVEFLLPFYSLNPNPRQYSTD